MVSKLQYSIQLFETIFDTEIDMKNATIDVYEEDGHDEVMKKYIVFINGQTFVWQFIKKPSLFDIKLVHEIDDYYTEDHPSTYYNNISLEDIREMEKEKAKRPKITEIYFTTQPENKVDTTKYEIIDTHFGLHTCSQVQYLVAFRPL